MKALLGVLLCFVGCCVVVFGFVFDPSAATMRAANWKGFFDFFQWVAWIMYLIGGGMIIGGLKACRSYYLRKTGRDEKTREAAELANAERAINDRLIDSVNKSPMS